MTQRLSDIKPTNVDLVHRGANARRWALAKTDEGVTVDDTIVAALADPHADEAAFVAELEKADADETVVKSAVGAFRLLKSLAAGLPEAAASMLGIPAAASAAAPATADPVKKEDKAMPEGVPVKKDDGSWDLSGVPEEQRAALKVVLKAHDDAKAERDALVERVEKAVEEADKLRDQALDREYLAKAETLDKLPLAPDEFAPVLKEIAGKVEPETFEKLETALAAANEAVDQGDLFAEIGRAGSVAKSDAESRIEAKAEEIRKADASLTKEQAYVHALNEDPDLYAQYRREVG